MNIDKLAAQDATRWAAAEMFFGEGAGTRRKLLKAEMIHKYETIPGYEDLVHKHYAEQNFAQHAMDAAKERKRIDRKHKIDRNVKGLLTGNKQSLTTGVAVIATVAIVAHQTGYDKVAWEYSQKKYHEAKAWAKNKQRQRKVSKSHLKSV